jgi:asparagine synthase (glutamine-hydrolysing)
MCGITGYVKFIKSLSSVDINNLEKMNNSLKHRGPDYQSVKIYNNKVGLGSSRLKIIDISDRSNMPFEDENFVISYNGEIYNFETLKKDLIDQGEYFLTNSDTEVIIKLFKKYGILTFDKLEGMFAVAIYDKKKSKLYLTRDVFGIKPLYYYLDSEKIIFSSEFETILNNFKIDNTLDKFSIYAFLKKGSVCEPHTVYKSIKSLKAGSILSYDDINGISFDKFNSLKDIVLKAENCEKKFDKKELIYEINKSIQSNLRADVDNSLMLSSGVDSFYMYEKIKKIKTFTISPDYCRGSIIDEIKNLKHLKIKFDFYKYFTKNDLINIRNMEYYKKNLSIDGEQYYILSNFIKSKGIKVTLSGIGGDEIVNSYPSFYLIPKIIKLQKYFPRKLKNLNISNYKINKLFRLLGSESLVETYLEFRSSFSDYEISKWGNNFSKESKNKLLEIYQKEISGIKFLGNKIKLLELNFYLKDQVLKEVDFASMQNSLEVRVPYLTKKILFLSSLVDQKKNLSKEILINECKLLKKKKYNKIPFLFSSFNRKEEKKLMLAKVARVF